MTATKPAKKAKIKAKAKKSTKKKLTLSIDKEVIEQGKALARDQGISLSKLIEIFLREQKFQIREPIMVVEPDPDILALMGKPTTPPISMTNRERYDDYAKIRYDRYLKNSAPE